MKSIPNGHGKGLIDASEIPGNDSHCTMFGALGAFGTGISIGETVELLVTGKLWFKVPSSIKFDISGGFPEMVTAKDIALDVLSRLESDEGIYKAPVNSSAL